MTPNNQVIAERTRLLAGVSAFAGIVRDALVGIATVAQEDRFSPGKVVIAEGEAGERLFLIVSGAADVSSNASGSDVILATLHRGDLFGEIAVVVPNAVRTATVKAQTPLVVISFTLDDLNRLCGEQPQVRSALESIAKRTLLFNFIRQSSPLSRLPADKISALVTRIKPMSVAPNTPIINQGDRGDDCYLLRSGKVDVVLKEGDASRVLSTLYPGALFGEASLLTHAVRNSSVISCENCELLAISRQDLFDAVVADREIASRMMELLQLRDRPRQKPGITEQVVRQDERGTAVVLKDAESGTYYRLTPEGKFIWDMLDGHHSLKDLTLAYLERFKMFSPQAIAEVVGGLGKACFLESVLWDEAVQKLLIRLPWFLQVVMGVRKVMESMVMLRHVDQWFSHWYERCAKLFFTKPARITCAVIAVSGGVAFSMLTPQIVPSLGDYALWQFGLWVIPPVLFSFALHELGHGFAVKKFSREVMGVGIGWYWVTPIAFVDTSDMWLAPRAPRMVVDLAGIMVNLVLVGLAMIPAWIVGAGNSYSVYAWSFAAISYTLILINLLPIRGTDGHYAVSDFLDRRKK